MKHNKFDQQKMEIFIICQVVTNHRNGTGWGWLCTVRLRCSNLREAVMNLRNIKMDQAIGGGLLPPPLS